MTKLFVYEIQAIAYSDFQHHILLHEKEFSKIEFRKMIEKARQKAKQIADKSFNTWLRYNYPDNFIRILKEDYGFVDSEHIIAYVGCNFDDICEVRYDD